MSATMATRPNPPPGYDLPQRCQRPESTRMTTLGDVDAFQDFAPEGLERLAARGRVRRFQAGEPLVRQGEVSDAMYVIVHGQVRKERSHPALSEPSAVLDLGPGESVGELGVL